MHELSLAQSIVELVKQQVSHRQPAIVEEIELEIGVFAGVEIPLLTFALESAVKGTPMEDARIVSHTLSGAGHCIDCGADFAVPQLISPCPHCGSYAIQLTRGREFRLKSIVIK